MGAAEESIKGDTIRVERNQMDRLTASSKARKHL